MGARLILIWVRVPSVNGKGDIWEMKEFRGEYLEFYVPRVFTEKSSTKRNGWIVLYRKNEKTGDWDYVNHLRINYTEKYNIVQVHPGDLNNDGRVNAKDMHAINTHYGKIGFERVDKSTNWGEKTSAKWKYSHKDVNAVYADANGDGIVNWDDLAVVTANLGKTW